MFWKKKIESEEFQELLNRIVLLVADVDGIKTEIANLKTRMNSLQGLENRKGKKKMTESEDLSTSMLLPNT